MGPVGEWDGPPAGGLGLFFGPLPTLCTQLFTHKTYHDLTVGQGQGAQGPGTAR